MYTNRSGFLIEFSGVDGAGKSTLAQLLFQELLNRKYRCVSQDFFVRPFYMLASSKMKKKDYSLQSLFSIETANLLITCDELLYYFQHTQRMAEDGYIVISARSLLDRKLKAKLDGATNIQDLETLISLSPIKPKYHFYLKVNLQASIHRIKERGINNVDDKRIERYINLADVEAQGEQWIIIDSNRPLMEVLNDILSVVIEGTKISPKE